MNAIMHSYRSTMLQTLDQRTNKVGDEKMFKVQNVRTKKFLKDAITTKVIQFSTKEEAQLMANSSEYYSKTDATAFNNIRSSKYIVVEC